MGYRFSEINGNVITGHIVTKDNADPAPDPHPSDNDIEVTAAAKDAIIKPLQAQGYLISESPMRDADVIMSYFIFYHPERALFGGRAVAIRGQLYLPDGTKIFKVVGMKMNLFNVVGALFEPSRDEMVSDAASECVNKMLEEMRKGTDGMGMTFKLKAKIN